MSSPGRIVILGAGPTGLGAAYRLEELGHRDVRLLEAADRPGGLAASDVDEQGFTWDVGGHVQFSHYAYYDDVLDRALGDAWLHHERESWIWIRDRFVPYPFQSNVHRLDPPDVARALDGLAAAVAARAPGPPRHFLDWILRTFGDGIAELFMVPYNLKVWGYPLDTLDAGWIGERVAVPDLERIRENVRLGRDDVSWGPNRTFRFPRHGGTGAIWSAVAGLLRSTPLELHSRVLAIDVASRTIALEGGRTVPWDAIVSSIPLDLLCAVIVGGPAVLSEAARLVHGSTHVVGVGLRGGKPPELTRKCWMYFPEPSSPYYRVTVFSHYSPHNVPPGEGHWSLMAEVTETPWRPVDVTTLKARVLEAMRRDGLTAPGAEVVSYWHRREERGYPTPFLGRDRLLRTIVPELEALGIYPRGRFGAWRYEVSNQDHSFMQGVEAVDRLLAGGDEPTLRTPDVVNGGAFLRREA